MSDLNKLKVTLDVRKLDNIKNKLRSLIIIYLIKGITLHLMILSC